MSAATSNVGGFCGTPSEEGVKRFDDGKTDQRVSAPR
jgi:hypothetical protein